MSESESNIIIYNTLDGKAAVALYAKDGKIWLNQMQTASNTMLFSMRWK